MGFLSELLTSLVFIPSIISQPSAVARLLGYSVEVGAQLFRHIDALMKSLTLKAAASVGFKLAFSGCVSEKNGY